MEMIQNVCNRKIEKWIKPLKSWRDPKTTAIATLPTHVRLHLQFSVNDRSRPSEQLISAIDIIEKDHNREMDKSDEKVVNV